MTFQIQIWVSRCERLVDQVIFNKVQYLDAKIASAMRVSDCGCKVLPTGDGVCECEAKENAAHMLERKTYLADNAGYRADFSASGTCGETRCEVLGRYIHDNNVALDTALRTTTQQLVNCYKDTACIEQARTDREQQEQWASYAHTSIKTRASRIEICFCYAYRIPALAVPRGPYQNRSRIQIHTVIKKFKPSVIHMN